MTHVHILKGRNSTSCTFVGGESYWGDAYTKREKTFSLFCFVLYYFCALVGLFLDAYTSCILHWSSVGHAIDPWDCSLLHCVFGRAFTC